MDNFKARRILLSNIKNLRKKQRKDVQSKDLNPSVFIQCPHCNTVVVKEKMEEEMWVCPKCDAHIKYYARKRLNSILDPGFEEIQRDPVGFDPLHFPNYQEKLDRYERITNLKEALVIAEGEINGNPCVMIVLEPRFMMGSMGSYVGDEIVRGFSIAKEKNLPVVAFCASGGARMQEGIFSLMQMAKTSNAVREFEESGNLYVSVLTDPTTGGVTASFASLGDIILAEPGALIGFTGPRVIKQTINQELPDGFQRAEFLLDHGFVDEIVHRKEMKKYLSRVLELHR